MLSLIKSARKYMLEEKTEGKKVLRLNKVILLDMYANKFVHMYESIYWNVLDEKSLLTNINEVTVIHCAIK